MKKLAFDKIGFGQVEPNKMPYAEYGGHIVADVPVETSAIVALDNMVQNGTILSVNYGAGTVASGLKEGSLGLPTVDSSILGLVVSENKLYSEFDSKKDFALFVKAPNIGQASQMPYPNKVKYGKAKTLVETVVPRLFLLAPGDIFTTNLIDNKYADIEIGDSMFASEEGYIAKDSSVKKLEFKVVQKTTMPDGQPGIKLAVVKA